MVRTGPRYSKIKDVKNEILIILLKEKTTQIEGMGFREIYKTLEENSSKYPTKPKVGSFTTLKECLKQLEKDKVVMKDEKGKYHTLYDCFCYLDKVEAEKIIDKANAYGGGSLCYPNIREKAFLVNNVFMTANLDEKTAGGLLHIIISDPFSD